MLYQVKQVAAQALRVRVSYVRWAIIISKISGGVQRGWRSVRMSESSCASASLSLALERYQTALAKRLAPIAVCE